MKLSQKIIYQELTRHFALPKIKNLSDSLALGRPYICDGKDEPRKDHVLVCRGKVPEYVESLDHEDFFILYIPSLKENPIHSSSTVLEFPISTDIWQLCNCVQEIYDKYDVWDETLYRLVQREENLTALLDASFSIFGNPLMLRASDYFMLACSSIIEERPELSHLLDPNFNFENLTTCKLDSLYSQAREYHTPFFLPEHLTGARELCVNLFEHRIFSYRLILTEKLQEIDAACAPLLAHLAEYISLSLSRSEPENAHASYSLEHLLKDVVSNKITDYSVLDNKFSEFGWQSSHDYCCLSLKTASLDRQNLTIKYLCHYFEEILTGACAFQYEDDIIIFVNLTRFGSDSEGLITSCVEFLRDSFLKAGISNTIHGTLNLYDCCRQSRIALDTGTRSQPYHWIHRFESLSLTWLLECCTKEMPTHLVCSQKILTLKFYDIRHNSDYCNTLRIYLKNHLNAVAAARNLYVHRSTFLYRLNRIKEIAGIDFEDEDMLFYLELSFRILQLEKNVSIGKRQ